MLWLGSLCSCPDLWVRWSTSVACMRGLTSLLAFSLSARIPHSDNEHIHLLLWELQPSITFHFWFICLDMKYHIYFFAVLRLWEGRGGEGRGEERRMDSQRVAIDRKCLFPGPKMESIFFGLFCFCFFPLVMCCASFSEPEVHRETGGRGLVISEVCAYACVLCFSEWVRAALSTDWPPFKNIFT